jgi:Fungal Zn(2)-Cys(6) binuclear cluster domain
MVLRQRKASAPCVSSQITLFIIIFILFIIYSHYSYSLTPTFSYLVDYLSPDPSDLPSQDPFQSPMSPVQSAASTPPLSNQHPSSNNHHPFDPAMASFATPVSLSSAPYSLPIPAFPRRAEHSYAQNNYLPHPYNMGAPPPPPAAQRPRGPQLPSASLLQPQQSTYVPDVPSSAPDAPPSGSGGSRKRPKYTRSKKGCLTCRSKKIKCDERKPLCTRCEHGHREVRFHLWDFPSGSSHKSSLSQCTWPETVLPRRPKGAVRGIGNEDDEEEDDERRGSIPGSAVSSHFPSSTTSTHFPGIGNNSPFDTAPRRDAFESDGFTNGSQFP